MTCREKLKLEHPDRIGQSYAGGCSGCPGDYGYIPGLSVKNGTCPNPVDEEDECAACWDREINGTNFNTFINLDEIRDLIDDSMKKRDRSVSIYIHPENGISVNVYPWPDADELYEMYQKGRITAKDFREKKLHIPEE